jgi:hypothetical protein
LTDESSPWFVDPDDEPAIIDQGILTLATTGSAGSTGRIVSKNTESADIGVKVRVINNGTNDDATFFGIGLRGQEGPNEETWAGQYAPYEGYVLEANPTTNDIRLTRTAGDHTSPDGAKWTYLLTHKNVAGADFDSAMGAWIRFEVENQAVRYKVWRYTDLEPDDWLGIVHDDVIRGDDDGKGKVGFAYSHNTDNADSGSVQFANVEFYSITQ